MNWRRLSYYVVVAVLLFIVMTAWHWTEALRFIQLPQLWWEPIAAGLATGILCAILGSYLILNRVVFLGLAVSQGAGLGIFVVFLIGGSLGLALEHSLWPAFGGVVFATLTAGIFTLLRGRRALSEEAITGLLYVIAAGLTIMIGDRISQGHHEIDDFLLGNAVAIVQRDLIIIVAVTFVLSLLHLALRRYFLYCSADEEFMRSRGIQTRLWTSILYLSLTIGITFSVKTLGLVPTFALLIIPAFIALKQARNITDAFVTALFIGAVCPPLGYYFSFLFSFPTGASIICIGAIFLLLSYFEPKPQAKRT